MSTADWDNPLWTNKQHLMSRLAESGLRVLYIDSLGLRTPSVGGRDLRRMYRRLREWRPVAQPIRDNLWRDIPLVVPYQGSPAIRRLNHRLLAARLRRNRRQHGIDDAVLWVYSPPGVHLFDPRWHGSLVYHCVDVLGAQPRVDATALDRDERELIRRADVCIASSRPLLERLRRLGASDPLYWPNPADTTAFAAVSRHRRPRRSGSRPVAGFVGTVQDHKVDMEIVTGCARGLPGWDFRLVGPVGGMDSTTVNGRGLPSNVHLLGTRPKEDLPEIVADFDVALIPYRINEYTSHVFPMKVFEYLGAGVPVVSTPLPSLVGEVEHVDFATDADGFVAALLRAAEPPAQGADAAAARTAYAERHSWEHRTDQALDLLQQRRARAALAEVGG